MGYNFEIHYRPGATNRVADAFSREYVHQAELGTMISACGILWPKIQHYISKDSYIQQICKDIETGVTVPKGYSLEHGVLRYKGRIVIPASSTLVRKLLQEFHDSPIGGHSGEFKTYQRIAQEWFWCGMRKSFSKYVQECAVCQ